MEQRRQMVEDWLDGQLAISALSRDYGVSRKTIYKWLNRFKAEGEAGLKEHSRAPHGHPNAVSNDILERLVVMKLRHRDCGPKKLLYWLKREAPEVVHWPAASTVGDLLKKQGLVKARRKRQRTPPYTEPFLGCTKSNQVWSADFKGEFRTRDGRVCYPLTITDNYSRYIILCRAIGRPSFEQTKPWFEWAFRKYGLPEAIRTDNGTPFASIGVGGLSRLSIWFIKLGIRCERIERGHPEQNGRHERMHRTLDELAITPPQANFSEQQRAFDRFVAYYDFERPHEALGQRPPAAVYQLSKRPYRGENMEIKYDPDTVVRLVRHNGEIRWYGDRIYLSQALAGEPVGLTQIDRHQWQINFGRQRLGILDELKGKVLPFPKHGENCNPCARSKVLPMSPVELTPQLLLAEEGRM